MLFYRQDSQHFRYSSKLLLTYPKTRFNRDCYTRDSSIIVTIARDSYTIVKIVCYSSTIVTIASDISTIITKACDGSTIIKIARDSSTEALQEIPDWNKGAAEVSSAGFRFTQGATEEMCSERLTDCKTYGAFSLKLLSLLLNKANVKIHQIN